MKEVVLRIEDSAVEKFLGFVELCPTVKVLSVDECIETKDVIDLSFAYAIRELKERNVFKKPADYTYIMRAANDGAICQSLYFLTPMEFIGYLGELGLEKLIGKSTLYGNKDTIIGTYPDWSFADADSIGQYETLRRKNIVVQFLSAFSREKRKLLDGSLE